MALSLHVIGCSPAWPNPGEACSSYLVEAGGRRILLDLGTGALAQLLEQDGEPVSAIVLSHLHWDHMADLVPLTYGLKYGWYSDWPRPALWTPPGGREQLRRIAEAAIGKDAFFEEAFDVKDYEPAAGLPLGQARLAFRAMRHPGASFAIRVEAGGTSLCYSGDSGPDAGAGGARARGQPVPVRGRAGDSRGGLGGAPPGGRVGPGGHGRAGEAAGADAPRGAPPRGEPEARRRASSGAARGREARPAHRAR